MTQGLAARAEGGAVAGHIARVAARLFAAGGYDATSVQAICEAAGVTKPTLYYHFGSKEGLARALLTDPLDVLVRRLREILDSPAGGLEKLEAMAETHLAFACDDPDRGRFLYALFFGPPSPGLASELARVHDELCGLDGELAQRLGACGVIAADRVDDFIKALRGMIVTRSMGFLYKGEPLVPGLARRMVGDLLWGFAGRGPAQEEAQAHAFEI